jgi:hypothetical protein
MPAPVKMKNCQIDCQFFSAAVKNFHKAGLPGANEKSMRGNQCN